MNKKEAQKEIYKAQNKFIKLQKKLDVARDQIAWAERMLAEAEPDTSELVFKPKEGEEYEYIGNNGFIYTAEYRGDEPIYLQRFKAGNVFRVGTAKNSAKYYFMNSKHDYWLPWSGQPKPAVLPKGLKYWNPLCQQWLSSSEIDDSHIYRWKRSEQ